MMSMEQDPRRRQIQRGHVSTGSLAKRKGSPCHQDDASQTGKRKRYSGCHLPEDIWHHICSFLPLKDAARAARASRIFQDSWRSHPILTFSKETMGFNENARIRSEMLGFESETRTRSEIITRAYNNRVGDILKKHSGIVKTLNLHFYGPYNADTRHCLDSWLRTAVKPGIEKLTLMLHSENEYSFFKENYNFPWLLLSNGGGNSILALNIVGCAFRPTEGLGCMRSLTSLSLCYVHITGCELGFLLSSSFALERLELSYCDEIVSIEIPFLLQRLIRLTVSNCHMLQVIESRAQNISSFDFDFGGNKNVELLLGEALGVKEVEISHPCVLRDARATLPSSTPNLETLTISSLGEDISIPMLSSKFLHLKYLNIKIEGVFLVPYDLFSLVSFLDAAPCLETFDLYVPMRRWEHESIVEDPSQLERIPDHRYSNLRRVSITRFYSTKMLVRLACHILENAPSLECLTLDLTPVGSACSGDGLGQCHSSKGTIVETPKALEAIRTYIKGKVPSTAKLNVVEPCNRCRGVDI